MLFSLLLMLLCESLHHGGTDTHNTLIGRPHPSVHSQQFSAIDSAAGTCSAMLLDCCLFVYLFVMSSVCDGQKAEQRTFSEHNHSNRVLSLFAHRICVQLWFCGRAHQDIIHRRYSPSCAQENHNKITTLYIYINTLTNKTSNFMSIESSRNLFAKPISRIPN